ncbi:MAG: TPM domain-containing protein [Gemmatimonadales bacterium]
MPAERERIEAAIAALERRSATELVVATVPASDAYIALRLLYAFVLGLIAQGCVHFTRPEIAFAWLSLAQLGTVVLVFILLGTAPVLRLLLSKPHAHHAVLRRAHEEFFARALFSTRERTGVLIFLSGLERQVVILGDEGIHARVKTQGWEQYVARIVQAIRQGRAADGVCQVIAELADVLEAAVPRSADDVNELPDTVREEER